LTNGESGGTYQTVGSVRHSGCSGSATRQRCASAYTGEPRAASSQPSGIPYRDAVGRLDLILDSGGERVLVDPLRGAGQAVVPVGAPTDLLKLLAVSCERARATGSRSDSGDVISFS
jgi:hypothetical protein